MKQCITAESVLEQFGPRDQVWRHASDGMFYESQSLAYYGSFIKALDLAQDVYITRYGDMHGVEFRIVTTTRTITTL